jgi:hypothetical protein
MLMLYSTRELTDFTLARVNLLHAENYITNDAPH